MRAWLVLRHLGVAFVERMCPFGPPGIEAWAQLRALGGSGKVPCLVDDRYPTSPIWDSLAITEAVAEHTPMAWPTEVAARTWARCAAAEMHAGFTALRECCSMDLGKRIELYEVPLRLAQDLRRLQALLSDGLRKHGGPWLGGAVYSAVDAFFAPVAFRMQTYQLALDPTVDAYFERVRREPHAAAWYDAALQETWSDEAHDAEILKFGRVVAEFRNHT